MPGSRRCAWYGRSCAADWKTFRTSTPHNSSRSSASSSRVDLPRGNTRRCYDRQSLARDARARGVVIGPKKYRHLSDKPRGRRPDIFKEHWEEMVQCLEERPDQTALELLLEFQARYPGRYSLRQLHIASEASGGYGVKMPFSASLVR